MSEKNVLIAAVVVLCVIAAAVGGFAKYKDSFSLNPSPSPSSEINLAGQRQASGAAETKKQMKQYSAFPGELPAEQLKNKKAVIETTKGKIDFEIYPEATKAASNFIFLTNDKYYDGLTFHRVEKGFVIQGGDPLGNGTGGPGYRFEDDPVTRSYDRGIVAMANAGPDTNGSQFFIMLANNPLPPNYSIFGKVLSGMEVVDKIEIGDVMTKVTIENLK